jgi:hypothetical protein
MKKLLVLASLVSLAFFSCKDASTEDPIVDPTPSITYLAPTTPSNRVAVLEDFTGVRCGYCPDGHVRAKAIEDALPGKFLIVCAHAGGYALPAAGWANFTSSASTAIHNQANPAGYPAGTMNRMPCMTLGVNAMDPARSNMTMGRGDWAAAANKVVTMTSPVNIGAKAVFDPKTRELAVTYDLYYTEEETVANNVSVMLLQDKLMAKQSGGTPDPNNYAENHVLRDNLNGDFGDVVSSPTTKGARVKPKTVYYTIPTDYNGTGVTGGGAAVLSNMYVYVVVSRGTKEILNAIKVDIK